MSHRINILLSDNAWEALQAIPKGQRSRFIDQAVTDNIRKLRRLQALENIDKLRNDMKPVIGTAEEWVREDRDNHLSNRS